MKKACMTIPPVSLSLTQQKAEPAMRRTIMLDLLVILGLILVGVSVYLWLGLPAMLAYAGVVLVVIPLALSQTEMGVNQ